MSTLSENPVRTWSYSKYATWVQCPRKFAYVYIDKLKEDTNAALENGIAVHKDAENFMKLAIELPDTLLKLRDEFVRLKMLGAKSEEFWNCDHNFKPVGKWDKPDKGNISKVDLYWLQDEATLVIDDVKTGKVRAKNVEQLEVYAAHGFNKFQSVNKIIARLLYVDTGEIVVHEFTRNQLGAIVSMWQARLVPFFAATKFPCNPTPLCNWCSFNDAVGGPCNKEE